MKVRLIKILSIFVFISGFSIFLYPDTIASLRRPTVVIGFQSRLEKDPAAGNWFTRVLIRELQKLPAVRTPSADTVIGQMKKYGMVLEQAMNLTNAARIASDLGCVQFIIGSLEQDEKDNRVRVRFSLYDAQTLELEAEDGMIVKSGMGLYDALDNFQREIINILFDSETLSSKLGLSISAGKALAYVNGGNYGEIKRGDFRWVRIKPKRAVKVEFRDSLTGMNLYQTNVILPPDSEKKLVYVPSARIMIEGLPGARIRRSDGTILNILTDGYINTEMHSFQTDNISIETRENKYLLEMETKVNSEIRIKAVKTPDPRKIDYVSSIPWLNLAIPGFAQFQANDVFLGYFFAGLTTAGIGLTVFGFYADSQMTYKSQQTSAPEDIKKFQTYGELYRTIGTIGAGIWAISALVSCAYAFWHPSRFVDPKLPDAPLALGIGFGKIDLSYKVYL